MLIRQQLLQAQADTLHWFQAALSSQSSRHVVAMSSTSSPTRAFAALPSSNCRLMRPDSSGAFSRTAQFCESLLHLP